jgi:hypothetical protein
LLYACSPSEKSKKIVWEKKGASFLQIERCPEKDGRTRPCGGNQRINRLLAATGGSLRNPAHRHAQKRVVGELAKVRRLPSRRPARKEADDRNFCAQIGNTALIT